MKELPKKGLLEGESPVREPLKLQSDKPNFIKADRESQSELQHEPDLVFDAQSGKPVKRSLLLGGSKQPARVALVVPTRRLQHLGPAEDGPVSENPHCLLPKHYFDAFLARARFHEEESGSRNLFSIETWDGRQVISYESIDS